MLEKDKFKHVLLDSGGFVARTKGKIIDVYKYIDFINKHKLKIAFNLDTNSIEESLKNQELLDIKTKAIIIPVYHYDEFYSKEYRKLLDLYIEKYSYISLGGFVNSPLSMEQKMELGKYVFARTRDKVRVHGLGVTTESILNTFPFYSVDSTSWLCNQKFGSTIGDNPKINIFRTKNRHYMYRNDIEIKLFLELEKRVTNLWRSRGITWKDL
jgi:hypothetical protein